MSLKEAIWVDEGASYGAPRGLGHPREADVSGRARRARRSLPSPGAAYPYPSSISERAAPSRSRDHLEKAYDRLAEQGWFVAPHLC